MRLLAVPNWSFARERSLTRRFEEILFRAGVSVHYCRGDLDHNRTVTAYSGEPANVVATTLNLAEAAFEVIDLNRHVGVHPRIGALDVLPFVPLPGPEGEIDLDAALDFANTAASLLADRFALPVFLYEKSESGRHESDLPSLRQGGFGGLRDRLLDPDYGPPRAHERLGAAVVGVRDFLLAVNVDLKQPNPDLAREVARRIRGLRESGDLRFLGVRALGFPLSSRGLSQVSMNLTLPDLTPVDPVVRWIREEVEAKGASVAGTELIGVIRDVDLPHAQTLPIDPRQVVRTTAR